MRRGDLLALALLILCQPCCFAGGKSSQQGSLGKTNFFTAGNGLGFAATERLTEYLAKVAAHFAGMDPPVDWAPYPASAGMFPDWLDESVARPGSIMALGQPRCAQNDFDRLAAHLKDDPPAPTPEPRRGRIIHIENPAESSDPASSRAIGVNGLDMRSIYGASCVGPAG